MMAKMWRLIVVLSFFLTVANVSAKPVSDYTSSVGENLLQYVNPFVGTSGFGNTYPGSQIPFGGIQMSPDTDFDYYDAAAGYKYNHLTMLGFSLTHLSGTGIPDLGDFLFRPGVGKMFFKPGTHQDHAQGYRFRYSHDKEWASPNYYAVCIVTGEKLLAQLRFCRLCSRF